MQLCGYIYNTIGNIVDDKILDILSKEDTKSLTKELIHCKTKRKLFVVCPANNEGLCIIGL
jgi:hypothetical protein